MEVRVVYTDPRCPSVELWETKEGVSIRNGKQGKPKEIVGEPDQVASAFFDGFAYASGK